jgi:prepilin-type N-terminal cleavage/methylation domain-containing protein
MIQNTHQSSLNLSSRRGFTLIELVLAMGLVGIVAISLYASLKISFNATAATDRSIEPSRTADLAMELIAGDLQNAIAPNTTITNAENVTDLTGTTPTSSSTSSTSSTGSASMSASSSSSSSSSSATPTGWVLSGPFEATQTQSNGMEADDLIFFSTYDGPSHVDGDGEIKMIELTIDTPQGASQPCLVRKVTSCLTSEQVIVPDEEILCRGVTGLTLQYFDGTNWDPTWDSTAEDNTLPVAVQVALNIQRPTTKGNMQTLTYTRIFMLSCSMAAQDTNVNTGASGGL